MRWRVALPLVFALAGCGDPTGTDVVAVHLATPSADDGAVALTIIGTGFAEVTPARPDYYVLVRQETPDTLKVMIFGTITDGPLLLLAVDRTRHIQVFSATVTDVARRDNSERDGIAGYDVTFLPPD